MPDSFPPGARAVHRAAARNDGFAAPAMLGSNLRFRLRWISVLPAVVVALLGASAVTWVVLASTGPVATGTVVALVIAGAGCLTVLVVAIRQADQVTVASELTVNSLRAAIQQGQAEVQRMLERLQRGERPGLGAPPAIAVDGGDAIASLQDALNRAQYAAQSAVVQASVLSPAGGPGAQVEVFVNLARRLQSLVHRAIQLLDDLENQVEDPDLLKGLFQVDHLATRIRRHAENLAVLGGADSRRQWTTPQALTEVLRSAIAEVEQYSRVKLVPPIEGTLHGHAVADVIHLVAELVENATMFSAPHTTVLLRVQTVTAGLVIEVEDRGLGMSRADQQRVNSLLADPQRIDVAALLRDGRLGLYVVSVIARRHAIAAQLQTNVFGGTQAVVIVPHGLLGNSPQGYEPPQRAPVPPQPQQKAPTITYRQPASVLPATQVPAQIPATPAVHATPPPKVLMPTSSYDSPQEATPGGPEPARGPAPVAPPAPSMPPAPPVPYAPPAPPASSDHAAHRATLDPSGRPPLPQRTGQTHIAPQLQQPTAAQRDEPAGEHDPQLMAAFRHGFSQAETSGRPDLRSAHHGAEQAETGTDEDDGTLNHPDRIS
jgi:signal transduction histidine kinase